MLKKQFQLRVRVVDAALASLLALPKPAFKSLNSIATMDATFPPSVQWTTRTCHHHHYLSKDELDDLRNNVNVGFGEELNVRWMLKKQFQLRIRVVDAALASLIAHFRKATLF
ncbi:unnamed protein product [Heligmosomoides polygyrus]|uniref:Uncharacterized protein n=1 Tax=Heligmosomoides polygyrus TaxID=6339 RepID=A0A183FC52_HELPZ|nr:unnamed protein product [Heligmosomoides polygyrus]